MSTLERKLCLTVVALITVFGLVPSIYAETISATHTETQPLGSGQIIKGAVTGCTGVESTVTVYYGHTDGGSNAPQWNASLGQEQELGTNGLFDIVLPGLSRNKLYYYRCHISNVLGSAWAPESGRFTNTAPGYTRSEVDAMADAIHEEWVNGIRQSATSRFERIGLRESSLGENWNVDTFEDWMQAYSGEVLDPPWEFDIGEPIVYSNNTASNALRSYAYAGHKFDYEGLNSLTDDDHVRERHEIFQQPTNVIIQLAELAAPGVLEMTHVAVLLAGHLEWDGDEYVCYLVRTSHWDSPREKQYGFRHIAFRKDSANNAYWVTSDLSLSQIQSFLRIAGPPGKSGSKTYGTYEEMYDYYKDSDVPAHFYTFGEE